MRGSNFISYHLAHHVQPSHYLVHVQFVQLFSYSHNSLSSFSVKSCFQSVPLLMVISHSIAPSEPLNSTSSKEYSINLIFMLDPISRKCQSNFINSKTEIPISIFITKCLFSMEKSGWMKCLRISLMRNCLLCKLAQFSFSNTVRFLIVRQLHS